jgi:hypothetical protein
MKNNLNRLLALGAIPLVMFLAGCTNPTGNDTPTPREAFLNFLNDTLPNVDHNVAVGSDYDGLKDSFSRVFNTMGDDINAHLGTLDIRLDIQTGTWEDKGKGSDILNLPGNNAARAGSDMGDYWFDVIWARQQTEQSVQFAGMIPQNTR